MEVCDHQNVVPVVYGFMNKDIVDKIYKNKIIYGGVLKDIDSAEWFCNDCLEELFDIQIKN